MIRIKTGKLPFKLPSNQIVYIEQEYNQFLNLCFEHTKEFERLFSEYYERLNGLVVGEEKCQFIYIPQLVKEWNKDANTDKLKASLCYNYPSTDISTKAITNNLSIDTVSYTSFLLKLFDESISEQITSGLLLYIPFEQEFIYFPLTSKDIDSLVQEIGVSFSQLKVYLDEKIKAWGSENFAIPVEYRDNVPDDEKADYDFTYDGDRIANEIRQRINLLKKSGHEELLLRLIVDEILKEDSDSKLKVLTNDLLFLRDFFTLPEKKVNRIEKFKEHYLTPKLSPIVIDDKYKIILPEYNNLEIKMTPLPKAVYFLFLRHQEGILFKELSRQRYKHELHSIYCDISNRECLDGIEKSIEDICNPLENSINEKCSRIKEAFLSQFNDEIAQHYYITGKRGYPKLITLDRTLVRWDVQLSFDDNSDGFTYYSDELDFDNF